MIYSFGLKHWKTYYLRRKYIKIFISLLIWQLRPGIRVWLSLSLSLSSLSLSLSLSLFPLTDGTALHTNTQTVCQCFCINTELFSWNLMVCWAYGSSLAALLILFLLDYRWAEDRPSEEEAPKSCGQMQSGCPSDEMWAQHIYWPQERQLEGHREAIHSIAETRNSCRERDSRQHWSFAQFCRWSRIILSEEKTHRNDWMPEHWLSCAEPLDYKCETVRTATPLTLRHWLWTEDSFSVNEW